MNAKIKRLIATIRKGLGTREHHPNCNIHTKGKKLLCDCYMQSNEKPHAALDKLTELLAKGA